MKRLTPYLLAALVLLAFYSLSACRPLNQYPLRRALASPTPREHLDGLFPSDRNPEPTPFPTPSPAGLSPTSTLLAPTSTQTATSIPSSTPTPILHKLSEEGCCPQPFWSPDGLEVLFIDRPSPGSSAGLWALPIAGGPPRLVTEQLGIYSPDLELVAFLFNRETTIERLSDGTRYPIPNGGRAVSFSHSGDRLAWAAGSAGPPVDTAWREFWISDIAGRHPQNVWGAFGGVLSGWTPDGRLLVSGRLSLDDERQAIWAVDLEDGSGLELGTGFVVRGGLISPGGSWLAYQALFSDQPEENGLWLADLRLGDRFRLDLFGSYRWLDDQRLLVFSADPLTGEHLLWQVVASTGQVTRLKGLEGTELRIAGGDWQVSPSGDHLVFVSAQDRSLWLLPLEGK